MVDLGAFRPGSAGGVAAADEAVAAGVSAVLAFNDQLALGILGRPPDGGIAVPQQMSVTGFAALPVARLLAPALTTVSVPMLQVGERAAGLLVDPAAQASQPVRLPVQLQVRASTMPRPTEAGDWLVAFRLWWNGVQNGGSPRSDDAV